MDSNSGGGMELEDCEFKFYENEASSISGRKSQNDVQTRVSRSGKTENLLTR